MTLAELRHALSQLRARWPRDWPGLAQVTGACWHRLGGEGLPKERPAVARLRRCALDLAARLERHGRERARQGGEPAYHNRLHTADVLVALVAMLEAQRRLDGRTAAALNLPEARLLLAALAHDGWHAGRINRRPGQQERASWRRACVCFARHGLSLAEQQRLGRLILSTEPAAVPPLHRALRGRPFTLRAARWQALLLQEADILASALPDPGKALTLALAEEWRRVQPAAARALLAAGARERFLRQAALFSSPASRALGLHALVRDQLGLQPQADLPPLRRSIHPARACRPSRIAH